MNAGRTLISMLALVVAFLIGRESAWLPATAQQAEPFARFAFAGYHHDGSLAIGADGHGIEHYRPYISCNRTILTACDKVIKNTIYTGGFVTFQLHRTAGNKAYGTITDSSLSWEVGATVTVALKPHDTVAVHTPATQYLNCGPKAPPGRCGA